MKWFLRLIVVVLFAAAGAGCDGGKTESHDGHQHKPGESHDHK